MNEKTIINYLQGHATEEEMALVGAWISESEENARRFFEMEEVHNMLLADAVPAERVDAALGRIVGEDSETEPATERVGTLRVIRSVLKYAAVLLIGVLIGGAYIYKIGVDKKPVETIIAKAIGGTQEMMLADGTKVWLHDGASLRYPEAFDGDQRKVGLDGEAYFEVAKDTEHPFVVEGDDVNVKVLGTKFNFKSLKKRHNDEVALVEGSVNVSIPETEESVILSPGQKASLDTKSGKLVVNPINATLAAVWRDDLIPFENANLREIGDALKQIYNVKVVYANGVDTMKTYSGVISRKDDVASVMRLLQNSIPMRYTVKGNTLTILP